jgi:hypothetical protein
MIAIFLTMPIRLCSGEADHPAWRMFTGFKPQQLGLSTLEYFQGSAADTFDPEVASSA